VEIKSNAETVPGACGRRGDKTPIEVCLSLGRANSAPRKMAIPAGRKSDPFRQRCDVRSATAAFYCER